MLARRHRFIGRDAVKPTLRRGSKLRSDGFSLRYAPAVTDRNRFAVVVSKKVDKRAVTRNRIRRRVYAVCADYIGAEPARDVVFIIYDQRLATIPADQLRQRLTDTLNQVFS